MKMKYSADQLKSALTEALAVIRQYDWLIDSYVLVCVTMCQMCPRTVLTNSFSFVRISMLTIIGRKCLRRGSKSSMN